MRSNHSAFAPNGRKQPYSAVQLEQFLSGVEKQDKVNSFGSAFKSATISESTLTELTLRQSTVTPTTTKCTNEFKGYFRESTRDTNRESTFRDPVKISPRLPTTTTPNFKSGGTSQNQQRRPQPDPSRYVPKYHTKEQQALTVSEPKATFSEKLSDLLSPEGVALFKKEMPVAPGFGCENAHSVQMPKNLKQQENLHAAHFQATKKWSKALGKIRLLKKHNDCYLERASVCNSDDCPVKAGSVRRISASRAYCKIRCFAMRVAGKPIRAAWEDINDPYYVNYEDMSPERLVALAREHHHRKYQVSKFRARLEKELESVSAAAEERRSKFAFDEHDYSHRALVALENLAEPGKIRAEIVERHPYLTLDEPQPRPQPRQMQAVSIKQSSSKEVKEVVRAPVKAPVTRVPEVTAPVRAPVRVQEVRVQEVRAPVRTQKIEEIRVPIARTPSVKIPVRATEVKVTEVKVPVFEDAGSNHSTWKPPSGVVSTFKPPVENLWGSITENPWSNHVPEAPVPKAQAQEAVTSPKSVSAKSTLTPKTIDTMVSNKAETVVNPEIITEAEIVAEAEVAAEVEADIEAEIEDHGDQVIAEIEEVIPKILQAKAYVEARKEDSKALITFTSGKSQSGIASRKAALLKRATKENEVRHTQIPADIKIALKVKSEFLAGKFDPKEPVSKVTGGPIRKLDLSKFMTKEPQAKARALPKKLDLSKYNAQEIEEQIRTAPNKLDLSKFMMKEPESKGRPAPKKLDLSKFNVKDIEERFRVAPKKLDLSKFNIKDTEGKAKVAPRKLDLSKFEAINTNTNTKIPKATLSKTIPQKATNTPLSIVKNIVSAIAAPVQQVCETQVDSWLQKPKSQLWIELNLEAILVPHLNKNTFELQSLVVDVKILRRSECENKLNEYLAYLRLVVSVDKQETMRFEEIDNNDRVTGIYRSAPAFVGVSQNDVAQDSSSIVSEPCTSQLSHLQTVVRAQDTLMSQCKKKFLAQFSIHDRIEDYLKCLLENIQSTGKEFVKICLEMAIDNADRDNYDDYEHRLCAMMEDLDTMEKMDHSANKSIQKIKNGFSVSLKNVIQGHTDACAIKQKYMDQFHKVVMQASNSGPLTPNQLKEMIGYARLETQKGFLDECLHLRAHEVLLQKMDRLTALYKTVSRARESLQLTYTQVTSRFVTHIYESHGVRRQ